MKDKGFARFLVICKITSFFERIYARGLSSQEIKLTCVMLIEWLKDILSTGGYVDANSY